MERDADFSLFANWHVLSRDIDPAYPVLGHLTRELCSTADEVVSLIMLYVAYYDLGSAITTWLEGWRPGKELDDLQLRRATGTERRGHRNVVRFAEHIAGMGMFYNQFGTWERALWPANVRHDRRRWTALQERLMAIRGNGRWAAYKTGEMLREVAGWDVVPTDAGHAYSSGPRKGLVDLFPNLARFTENDEFTIARLNSQTDWLVGFLGLPVEQVETVLCDWHSMITGHYYVGHDIDLMLNQMKRAPKEVQEMLFVARAHTIDMRWRGEVQNWSGVRKHLNSAYRDKGVIEWWK